MTSAEYVFWACLLLIGHAYFLYPFGLFFAYVLLQIRRDWRYLTDGCNRRAPSLAPDQLPAVTLIVPAYNEQERLPDKIANLREIDYPRE